MPSLCAASREENNCRFPTCINHVRLKLKTQSKWISLFEGNYEAAFSVLKFNDKERTKKLKLKNTLPCKLKTGGGGWEKQGQKQRKTKLYAKSKMADLLRRPYKKRLTLVEK